MLLCLALRHKSCGIGWRNNCLIFWKPGGPWQTISLTSTVWVIPRILITTTSWLEPKIQKVCTFLLCHKETTNMPTCKTYVFYNCYHCHGLIFHFYLCLDRCSLQTLDRAKRSYPPNLWHWQRISLGRNKLTNLKRSKNLLPKIINININSRKVMKEIASHCTSPIKIQVQIKPPMIRALVRILLFIEYHTGHSK